jgi:predicted acyl esterase
MIVNLVRRLGRIPRRSRLVGGAVAALMVVAALSPIAAGQARAGTAALTSSTASTIWPGGTWEPGPATYGVYTEDNVPFTMSDGVVLYGTVAYPEDQSTGQKAAGKFPVLLMQNPYGDYDLESPSSYLVERGYIFAMIDVRDSTSRSSATVDEDSSFFGPRNAQDGADEVNYLAHDLPGSNGIVGLYGCSFLGVSELFTEAAVGPNSPVKAAIPACSAMGYDTFFSGGIPGEALDEFGTSGSDVPGIIPGGVGTELWDNVSAGGTQAYSGAPFWTDRDIVADAQAIVNNKIPTLLWTGDQAFDAQGSIELYDAFQNAYYGRNPYSEITNGEPVTGDYQIVEGNGGHAQGLDDAFDLEWYDHYLKGASNGINDTTTPMHLYEANSGRWVNAAHLPAGDDTSYYLSSGQSLTGATTSAGQETVTWAQPTSDQSASTLVFNAKPLAATTDVAGPVSTTVYASSTSTDLELTATLEDVTPSGGTTVISDGAITGALRQDDPGKTWVEDGKVVRPYQDDSTPVPLTPGKVEQYDIQLQTVLYSVPAGDSLRLVIATQAPSGDCDLLNVLSPAEPCNPTATQTAALTGSTGTVLYGGSQPSLVNIPLVNPYSLPAALSCVTASSWLKAEPMEWNGGTDGPRNSAADTLTCLNGINSNS